MTQHIEDFDDILDYAEAVHRGVQDGETTWFQLGELVEILMDEISTMRVEQQSLANQLDRTRYTAMALAYSNGGARN